MLKSPSFKSSFQKFKQKTQNNPNESETNTSKTENSYKRSLGNIYKSSTKKISRVIRKEYSRCELFYELRRQYHYKRILKESKGFLKNLILIYSINWMYNVLYST